MAKSKTTTSQKSADVASQKSESVSVKLTVAEMLTVVCRAFAVVASGMNAACLDGMRAGRYSLRTFTVVRKVAVAAAKNRPDVTVKASDANGDRIKIVGDIGADSVELTGIGLPRELLTDVFAVPSEHIEALYADAQSALENAF